ncbi:MAG: EutN/CcmL family microcompartment protein [Clostridiales bacterium]|jgi:ethanolamine utilization protein EutN|nr:EutN/CcmL family microcompartment protein [Clostridiales bacterium]
MLIGKVVGSVVSTRKHEKLLGNKFMVVEIAAKMGKTRLVAVDKIGAGVGENVLIATGSAARTGGLEGVPVDAAIVGIIDEGQAL